MTTHWKWTNIISFIAKSMNFTSQNSHCCLNPMSVVSYFGVGCSLRKDWESSKKREESVGRRLGRKKSEIRNLITYRLDSEKGNLGHFCTSPACREHTWQLGYIYICRHVMDSYLLFVILYSFLFSDKESKTVKWFNTNETTFQARCITSSWKGKTREKTNAEIATARSKVFIFCRSVLPGIAPKIQDHKVDLIKGSQKNR